MNRALPCLAFAVLLAAAGAARAQEPETYAFQLEQGDTKCTVNYPRSDGETLYLLVTKDGKFNAGVYKAEWEALVDGKDDSKEDYHVVLDLGDAGKTTSQWGGYENGFNQGVWAAWDAGSTSDDALAMLKNATMASVVFDGQNLGTFDMKQKGMAAILLATCLKTISQ